MVSYYLSNLVMMIPVFIPNTVYLSLFFGQSGGLFNFTSYFKEPIISLIDQTISFFPVSLNSVHIFIISFYSEYFISI